MPYSLVLFDFDGTLADTAGWFKLALNESARRFGFRELAPHEFEALRGLNSREIVRALRVPAWRIPAIAAHLRQAAAARAGHIALFPGTVPMLAQLRARGVRLAIVSSNRESTIRAVLDRHGVGPIDAYACGASLFGKAGKMRQVLRRTGIPADRALAIGDEGRDIDAAHAVGMAAGAVAWGYATPAALAAHGPAHRFTTLDQIAALLAR